MGPLRIQALTLLALASAAVFADSGKDPVRTGSERVALSGLDLTTPAGVRVARRRIGATCQHLCTRLAGPDGAENHAAYDACLQRAVTGAELKLAELLKGAAPALVTYRTSSGVFELRGHSAEPARPPSVSFARTP